MPFTFEEVLNLKQIDLCNEKLFHLKQICAQFVDNPNYVYGYYNGILIVLKKYSNTHTNEHKKDVIEPLYATFIGDTFTVECMIDVHTFKHVNKIHRAGEPFVCTYRVYEIGHPVSMLYSDEEFSMRNLKRFSITYYKTIERAFFANDQPLINYTGFWFT